MKSANGCKTSEARTERRDSGESGERLIGRVIACDGGYATISSTTPSALDASAEFWSIGRMISILVGENRVIGLVYKMSSSGGSWDERKANTVNVQIELIGEIRTDAQGKPSFNRGIATYPPLGAVAHRIRSSDLAAVHLPYAKRSMTIGRLSQDESIPAAVDIDSMLDRHFAIVGTTGTGKSTALALLLRKAVEARPELRALVFDPHNEFASAFPDKGNIITKDTLELPFWLFQHEEFTEVVFRGREGVEEEIDALRDLIPEARARFNAKQIGAGKLVRRSAELSSISVDSPLPYRMTDLYSLIEDEIGRLQGRHDRLVLKALKTRLDALVSDPRYRFMFSASTIDDNMAEVMGAIFRIPHEDRPVTILQLAGVPSEVVNSVISVLCRMAFDLAMWSNGTCEMLVVCEEAHRYVPHDPSHGFGPTRRSISRIAKEGRKYGAYLGVVTQRPGELDPTILSQCSTIFALRLANDHDQEIIRSAISDSSASTISFLSSIGNREAIAFGEGVATPMRMKFQELDAQFIPGAPAYESRANRSGQPGEVNLTSIINRMRAMHEAEDDHNQEQVVAIRQGVA